MCVIMQHLLMVYTMRQQHRHTSNGKECCENISSHQTSLCSGYVSNTAGRVCGESVMGCVGRRAGGEVVVMVVRWGGGESDSGAHEFQILFVHLLIYYFLW